MLPYREGDVARAVDAVDRAGCLVAGPVVAEGCPAELDLGVLADAEPGEEVGGDDPVLALVGLVVALPVGERVLDMELAGLGRAARPAEARPGRAEARVVVGRHGRDRRQHRDHGKRRGR